MKSLDDMLSWILPALKSKWFELLCWFWSVAHWRENRWPKIDVLTKIENAPNAKFKLKLRVEIVNNSGCPVVVIPTGFVPDALKVDPNWTLISGTTRFETKLFNSAVNTHELMCILLGANQRTDTWIGASTTYEESKLQYLLDFRRCGTLFFTCCWLDPLPVCQKVSRRI